MLDEYCISVHGTNVLGELVRMYYWLVVEMDDNTYMFNAVS
jgi:hypothetical protein